VNKHPSRAARLAAQAKQRTMMFRITVIAVVLVAVTATVAFGPVWLVAEATRLSQISVQRQEIIAAELATGQTLVVEAAVLRSSDHIATRAQEEHGMVAPSEELSVRVEVGDSAEYGRDSAVVAQRIADHEDTLLVRVAQLMAGEASALLVGDVGMSAVR